MKQKTFSKRYWNYNMLFLGCFLTIAGLLAILLTQVAILGNETIDNLKIMTIVGLVFLFGYWIVAGLIYCIIVFFRAMKCGMR